MGPYFKPHNADEVPCSNDSVNVVREVEKIILWSFARWSTSNPEEALYKMGTRGLWLIQRTVREYSGAITVRAEDASVGCRYEKQCYMFLFI